MVCESRKVVCIVLLVTRVCSCLAISNAGSNKNEGSVLSPAKIAGHISGETINQVDWDDSSGNLLKREGSIPLNVCPKDCSKNGQCVFAEDRYVCTCKLGFAGDDCSKTFCDQLNSCSGHGHCQFPSYNKTLSFKERTQTFSFLSKLQKAVEDPTSFSAGDEGEYGCVCDEGFTGIMCDQRTCKSDCGVNGYCRDGVCHCAQGFTGQECEYEICQGNCNGNGFCEGGVCNCKDGFLGIACDIGPNGCTAKNGVECSGNGVCKEGQCMCTGLWLQPDCSHLTCLSFCSGHGLCHNGTCACDEGFEGSFCNYHATTAKTRALAKNPECAALLEKSEEKSDAEEDEEEAEKVGEGTETCIDPKCSGHGVCIDGVNCKCENGFGGETCAEMVCPRACSGHGSCLREGICKCEDHYAGVACNQKTCSAGCSGHGKCVNTECMCDSMWGGELCAFRLCPGETEECTGHGDCQEGVCHCHDRWYGEKCDLIECPSAMANVTCSGHGLCQLLPEKKNPECVCIGHWPSPQYKTVPMWKGDDCNTKSCADPHCSGNGACEAGDCVCKEGHSGDGCEIEIADVAAEEGVACKVDPDCSAHGKCINGHCYCKGIKDVYGKTCHKTAVAERD